MTSRLQAKLLAQRALFQRLQSSKKRNKLQAGFTLVELLIVVVILGILSAVGIPAYLGQVGRARENAADSAAMAAAKGCAALTVAGTSAELAAYAPGDGVTGTCNASGTVSTFTTSVPELTTQAVGTVTAGGAVQLTTSAVD